MAGNGCLFCGGDSSEHDHARHCDGRQGAAEAREAAEFPPFISGATAATWGTSAAAAESVEAGRDTQRARVREVIFQAGRDGHTDDEIQAILGLGSQSECPRRRELETLGLIVQLCDGIGRVVRRATRKGRSAVVWIDRRVVDA